MTEFKVGDIVEYKGDIYHEKHKIIECRTTCRYQYIKLNECDEWSLSNNFILAEEDIEKESNIMLLKTHHKYIAKDKNNIIYVYNDKPQLFIESGEWKGLYYKNNFTINNNIFDTLDWKDSLYKINDDYTLTKVKEEYVIINYNGEEYKISKETEKELKDFIESKIIK